MNEKISDLGEYKGYSKEVYDGYKRFSQYIPVSDEAKIAADIFLPSLKGVVASKPLPAIWSYIRYHRSSYNEKGELVSRMDVPFMKKLLLHGYVIAAVDVRGGGASFGTRRGEMHPEEAQDGYDITEWMAKQPWCNGKIGMYGQSYMGNTQFMTAGKRPPHLKAIIPEMAMFDLYSLCYLGGVFREGFITEWAKFCQILDKNTKPVQVDEDHDGSLASMAVEQHQLNWDVQENMIRKPYRDSDNGEKIYLEWSPNSYLKAINESGIAVYNIAGWFDMYPRDQLTWHNNLETPKRILMTPWAHTTGLRYTSGWHEIAAPLLGYNPDFDEIINFHFTEMIRWYDYWLKGIDNGIMNEPPIHYYTIGAPKEKAWRTSNHWPLVTETQTPYYLLEGISGSITSVNDGKLNVKPPNGDGHDVYMADSTTTTGKETRWTNGYGFPIKYPDMRENDSKALTYTTKPISESIEITGHPILHLWVSAKNDVDLFAYLEEVDDEGYSHYLTEGVLRASHRALSEPNYEYMGLPYHRSFKEDILPINEEPVELVFDLFPISNIFDAGHRIRLAITCADRDNYETKELLNTKITVHRNKKHLSFISLPIIR